MAIRDGETGRVVIIRLCVVALGEGRVVPAQYRELESFCPDHDAVNGTCLDTFHAESRMAAWSWRAAWHAWRFWRGRATHRLMGVPGWISMREREAR